MKQCLEQKNDKIRKLGWWKRKKKMAEVRNEGMEVAERMSTEDAQPKGAPANAIKSWLPILEQAKKFLLLLC